MPDFVTLVKRAALDAVDAAKPVEFAFGEVVEIKPLRIRLDQKSFCVEDELVLTRQVSDYYTDIEVSMLTEVISHGHSVRDTYSGGGTAEAMTHDHPISGIKRVKVCNALMVGDKVLMLRMQGGKKYVVLDRIKPCPELKGEWI